MKCIAVRDIITDIHRIRKYKKQSSPHKLYLRREAIFIARSSAPIHIVVHAPQTEEGKLALAKQVAEVHADLVDQTIKRLSCPADEKLRLLDAVIHSR